MKFSITRFVPEVLRARPEQRLTAREIAALIMEKYPQAVRDKQERSTAKKVPLDSQDAMLQQIVAEIGAQRQAIQKKDGGIKSTEGRPRKYYFTTQSDEAEVNTEPSGDNLDNQTNAADQPLQLSEYDLYPLLARYLKSELAVFAKRIDEKRSKNNRGPNGNKWLYPDLVGMEDLSENWDREIIDCAKEYSDKKTKLWSFEVKLRLNSANVRQSYFQAVSNSSWSNIGYLVAAEIGGNSTISELRMLSGLHGIGVIEINPQNPTESQILIPAAERTDVDWGTMNRLLEENTDFRDYVRQIRQFYQTGDLKKTEWESSAI